MSGASAPLARIVFFGTPEFAVPTLAALVAAGRVPILVVSQPSRPAGRGGALREPAVARFAREQGIPVRQPERVRDPEFLAELAGLAPDVAVVAAYGRIFPPALLALPRHGCINVHASLLPRWRGAAPIQAAIAAGDAETGVTIMRMEAGLDTGPILLREATTIGAAETAGELAERLAGMGGALLVRALAGLEAGTLVAVPQDDAAATYAPTLRKEEGRVRWDEPASRLAARLRAFTPWPGLTAALREAPLRLLRSAVAAESTTEPPGTYLGVRGTAIAVACGGGSVLALERVQRAGRQVVAGRDLANGERLRAGERLG